MSKTKKDMVNIRCIQRLLMVDPCLYPKTINGDFGGVDTNGELAPEQKKDNAMA